jgi:hypothetical protein
LLDLVQILTIGETLYQELGRRGRGGRKTGVQNAVPAGEAAGG